MFDIIKSYFKDKKFYIVIHDDGLLIKNYQKIYNITDSNLILSLDDKNLHIKGSSFIVKEVNNKELSLSGKIESIDFND